MKSVAVVLLLFGLVGLVVAQSRITSFNFFPTVVDTSLSAVSSTFTCSVTSPTRIVSCRVTFLSPGPTAKSIQGSASQISQGNAYNGTLSGFILVPLYASQGNWTLSSISCQDEKFAQVSLTRLQAVGLGPLNILQTARGDNYPPVIVAAVISPTTINTSVSSANVNLDLTLSDDFSGLSSCSARLTSTTSVTIYASCSQTSGTLLNGIISCGFVVPQFSVRATWCISYLSCYDKASYSISTPTNLTSVCTTQSNIINQDLLPPRILSISLTSGPLLDVRTTPSIVSASVTFMDDMSGGMVCSFVLFNPLGTQVTTVNTATPSTFPQGAPLFWDVSISYTIPMYSLNGTWWITSFSCQDKVNRFSTINTTTFRFVVLSVQDLAPPTILGISATPSVVDTSSNDALLSFQFLASDPSGVASCYGILTTPLGSSIYLYPDNTLASTYTLPRFSAKGNFTISLISCTDRAQNTATQSQTFATISQVGFGDTTPPTILGLRFSPTSIDTSQQEVAVVAYINATDVSGLRSCSAVVAPPLGALDSSLYSNTVQISGTVLAGVFSVTINFPIYSAQGAWRPDSVTCSDVAGNTMSAAISDFVRLGIAINTVQQTGAPDISPPTITAFSLSPTVINTSTSSAIVNFVWNVQDDVGGISQIYAVIVGPDGSTQNVYGYGSPPYPGNSRTIGLITGQFSASRFSPPGFYTISTIVCTDSTGKSVTMVSSSFLSAFGQSPIRFSQVAAGNLLPPSISSVSLAPQIINTALAAVLVTATISVTSDMSGIQQCYANVVSSTGSYLYCNTITISTISAPIINASAACVFNVPRYTLNGTWNLQSLTCSDNFGRSSSLTASNFAALGLTAVSFQQTGAPDMQPPAITAVSFTPLVIDTSLSAVSVSILINATDLISGIQSCSAYVASPIDSGSAYTSACSSPSSSPGSMLRGQVSCYVTLPLGSLKGNWSISYVSCNDNAQNSISLTRLQLLGLGIPVGSFRQVGVEDLLPPSLLNITLSQTSVDTSAAQASVTFLLWGSDDIGISQFSGSLVGPDRTYYISTSTLTAGGPLLGSMTMVWTLPRFSPSGWYTLTSLSCTDASGKTTTVASTTGFLLGSAVPLRVQQIGPGDLRVPNITGIHLLTSAVDSSQAAATFLATLNASDDFAGVQYVNIYIGPPSGALDNQLSCTVYTYAVGTLWASLTCSFTMPLLAAQGTWTFNSLTCYDYANRYKTYNAGDLIALGITPPSIQQTGLADSQPPQIFNFSMSPTVVNTSAGAAAVTVTFFVGDDRGINTCAAYLLRPDSGSLYVSSSTFSAAVTTGTKLLGTISTTLTIPQYSPAGFYTVSQVVCYDGSSKSTQIFSPFPSTFGSGSLQLQQVAPGSMANPSVLGLSVSPSIVDTSLSAAYVTAAVTLQTDISGLAYCRINIVSPDGSRNIGCTTNTYSPGTFLAGTASCVITMPRYAPIGQWTLSSLYCLDNYNRNIYIYPTDLARLGLVFSGVTQQGKADLLPPSILSFALSPQVVDTSSTGATLFLSWVYFDDISGVASLTASFVRPDASTFSVNAQLSQGQQTGSPTNGSMVYSYVLPRLSLRGFYNVTRISCTDVSGKTTTITSDQFVPMQISSGIPFVQQIGIADTQPPSISAVAFLPATIDTSSSTATVTAMVSCSDDRSGLQYCVISVSPPTNALDSQVYCYTPSYALGVFLNGTISCTITFPRYAAAGNWSLSYVTCYDNSNKNTNVYPSTLVARGASSPIVQQTGQADIFPPNITSFQYSPRSVNTALGPAPMSFSWSFKEDVSGVSYCYVSIQRPDSNSFSAEATAPTRLTGSIWDGRLNLSYSLPQSSPPGSYSITSISCCDTSRKCTTVSAAQMTALLGIAAPITFQQTGVGDLLPPTISGVTFNPSIVNSSAAAVSITAAFNVSDDASGANNCYVYVMPPASSPSGNIYCFTSSYGVGVVLSSILTCTIEMPRYSSMGVWSLNYVSCSDNFGRSTTLYATDFLRLGLALPTLNQTGVADMLPPTINNFTISPLVVNTSDNAVTLTLSWNASDDMAGIQNVWSLSSRFLF